MQTMNISLPDPMKQFVEKQVEAGDYSSASEYVRELVRSDQRRQAREQLEQTLLTSAKSGDPLHITSAMVEDIRKRLRARATQRESKKR